jgi:hypothetical protein
MPTKSSRSSNKRCDNLGPGTPHSKNQERAAPTYRKNDRVKMDIIRKTNPSHKQRRTPKIQRRILRSGATSIRSLGITLLIVAQRSQWCPK